MSLLDSLRQSLSLDASGYPSRRPRSPSLNHNVKQPAERRISRPISTIVTASQQQPRSSVGAGYRCEVRTCQTLKSSKKRFFSGPCGHTFRQPSLDKSRLYIGAALAGATSGRSHAAVRQFKPANKGLPGFWVSGSWRR